METQFDTQPTENEAKPRIEQLTSRVPSSGPEGAEKLDKVRDILFGNEFRAISLRFAKLEESQARQFAELREEFRNHLSSFEQALKSLSDDFLATTKELRRDKADKLALAELFEAIAQRLREDHESMSD